MLCEIAFEAATIVPLNFIITVPFVECPSSAMTPRWTSSSKIGLRPYIYELQCDVTLEDAASTIAIAGRWNQLTEAMDIPGLERMSEDGLYS